MTRIVTTHIPDKPGELGKLARCLAEGGINIDAFEADRGNLLLIADDADQAVACLKEGGFDKTRARDVVEVRLPNKPGQLASLGEALGKADVNIVSTFGAGGDGRIFLNVDNVTAAQPVVEKFGATQVHTA